MRRRLITLLLLVPLACGATLFAVAPAHANSFPGLVEQDYTRVESPSGDSYTVRARIAIEVETPGVTGRLRFRLECFRTDADTGTTAPNSCDFHFSSGANGFWCSGTSSPTNCSPRDFPDVENSSNSLWVGSWHALQPKTVYAAKIDSFQAVFNSGAGPAGVFHAISSGTVKALRATIGAEAESEIGVSEPTGCMKYGDCSIDWCAMFARWVWDTAGVPGALPSTNVARGLGQWGVDHGLFKDRGSGFGTPQVGDWVIYGEPGNVLGGHVDVIVSVGSSTITVVGGNRSGAVRQKTIDPRVERAGTGNFLISGYVSPPGT
jgi:hypothetical protein